MRIELILMEAKDGTVIHLYNTNEYMVLGHQVWHVDNEQVFIVGLWMIKDYGLDIMPSYIVDVTSSYKYSCKQIGYAYNIEVLSPFEVYVFPPRDIFNY